MRTSGKSKAVRPAHQNPLSYAITTRDQTTLQMVEEAVAHKQVMLAYQPVVQATNQGNVAFYEGLIRVLDGTGRIIPAKDFIEAIETTETGRVIDCLALEQGLHVLTNTPSIRLAINMSARSIGYPRWNKVLKRGLAQDSTVAERLVLEITESSAMLVPELVVNFMNDLQKRGITFALDDFGSGYTTFRNLMAIEADMIKIDGTLIEGIATDPNKQTFVRMMVDLAQTFSVSTVAEMVDSRADAEVLRRLGVDYLQGFMFGVPSAAPSWQKRAG